ATVLTIHGWNVIQPVVDLGFGCAAGTPVGPAAAVSQAFAAEALPAFVDACGARGILATAGVRYPPRRRGDLIPPLTPRYRADPRRLVRHLAALGSQANALQLELGVPLRWPGRWRQRLVDACTASLPALLANGVSRATPPTASAPGGSRQRRHTLEIAA